MATLHVTFSLRTGLEEEDEVPSRFITFTEDQLKEELDETKVIEKYGKFN